MQLNIIIEKSHEGEYRATLRKPESEFDLITMPWIVGQDAAIKKLAILLANYTADVTYCIQNNIPMSREFLRRDHDPKRKFSP